MELLLRQRLALLVLVALQLLFVRFPGIDLIVAGWLFRPGEGFFLREHPLVVLSYELFADLHLLVIAALVWLLVASLRWRRKQEVRLRRQLLYLLLVLALGPGLLVNALFKSESGRARPHQTEQFGGSAEFTAVFSPAANCRRNCSFVSGHAAMGFYFIAFAWVRRDRRWLAFGVVLGGLVGLGRMLQGAHFLSDVVFSFWVVYAVCVALSGWLGGADGGPGAAAGRVAWRPVR